MIKASFISRALISRYADVVELDAAMCAAQGTKRKQLADSTLGAIKRIDRDWHIDKQTAQDMIELSEQVNHEIDKRKVERSRIAKARQKMRDEATKDALEDALFA